MKILAFLLALYIFSASVFPCSDVGALLFSTHDGHATHQSEASNDDNCSTLCVCNCCGIVCSAISTFENLSAPYIHSNVISTFIHEPRSNVRNPIWRPPKVS